jgi:hypothetical protein
MARFVTRPALEASAQRLGLPSWMRSPAVAARQMAPLRGSSSKGRARSSRTCGPDGAWHACLAVLRLWCGLFRARNVSCPLIASHRAGSRQGVCLSVPYFPFSGDDPIHRFSWAILFCLTL